MTFSDLFKVTIIQRQENGIAYSYTYNGRPIESRIMIYRTVPLSVTLNDLSFKVTPLFDAEYLRNGTTQT